MRPVSSNSPFRLRRLQDQSPLHPNFAGSDISIAAIAPDRCDSAVTQWCDDHLVMRNPMVSARNQLFLFLCGSYGTPTHQKRITSLAANMGYHAINLSYPNSWTVGGLCRDATDTNCHGKLRLDILDGGNRSGLIDIGRKNSIEARLYALLNLLSSSRTDQGWEQFCCGSHCIDWSKVVVAGHSQGGGQAAIIGKTYQVLRVVMLAAPVDFVRTINQHADWISAEGVTPTERYFGFVHSDDEGFDRILECWKLMRLDDSAIAVVDQSDSAFKQSRRLVTRIKNVRRGKYHACVAQDNLTPIGTQGQPVFEPVWHYLLNAHA
ncbi:BPSS1187 family protein [Thiorhodovibrio frisius]|uniref:Uncharacterized protein n=1 Tax=Thiorhodovibrio frisius TaxID=631362 RepID=H8YZW8_9GAMM|nr:hypothetical protein [Thiorhodovibrio frisius]EIC22245.1 hypothetical protein Thi970DRAFT_02498 [Thiorhodovibrio frisius]WPL24540.1 hypothetical protein Thiofri_04760 [Thiorhodovibrio frisius]